MKIRIDELRTMVIGYLQSIGLGAQDAETFSLLVIEQELVGNRFSAIGELAGKHARMHGSAERETVIAEKAAMSLLKGNGRSAPLITADHLEEVTSRAKRQGLYALGIYDSTYNDFFDVFCRRIAARDCIAVIVENGGPQGVTPFGGRTDVTGTNPIAYGIPTNGYPIVFDAATAMHAYGLIGQAKERGERLPENAYVDREGEITTDPNRAHAVLPFGGFKGYAINLLIDVLSGSLVRGRSGLDQPPDSQRYIGTFILVIDPAAFGDIEEFKRSTTKLAADLLAVPPVHPDEPVRVPGFRGAARRESFEREGSIEIEDDAWEKFSVARRANDSD